MNQEFITSNGKVVRERNILFIKTRKFQFSDSSIGQWLWALVPVFSIVISCYLDGWRKVSGLFYLVLFFDYLKLLYKLLFIKSFANRIPLEKIISFEIKPDKTGLETNVILKLKTGRNRTIAFRTLEKQYEPFTELISQPIFQFQPA